MEIKNVLFDLDGTLLPMDMERFTNGYFQLLTEKMAPLGYDPKALIDAVWAGTAAMVKNDGSRLNEEAFWAKFAQAFGPEALADQPVFEATPTSSSGPGSSADTTPWRPRPWRPSRLRAAGWCWPPTPSSPLRPPGAA